MNDVDQNKGRFLIKITYFAPTFFILNNKSWTFRPPAHRQTLQEEGLKESLTHPPPLCDYLCSDDTGLLSPFSHKTGQ